MAIFVVIQAKYANFIESTQTRRIQAELGDVCHKSEGNWSHKLKEIGPLQKFYSVANFHNLLCLHFDLHLTTFFCDFFLNYPLCIFGSSDIFVISLYSKLYISLRGGRTGDDFLCNNFGAKAFNSPTCYLFPHFPSFSLTFTLVKHSLRMKTQGMLG